MNTTADFATKKSNRRFHRAFPPNASEEVRFVAKTLFPEVSRNPTLKDPLAVFRTYGIIENDVSNSVKCSAPMRFDTSWIDAFQVPTIVGFVGCIPPFAPTQNCPQSRIFKGLTLADAVGTEDDAFQGIEFDTLKFDAELFAELGGTDESHDFEELDIITTPQSGSELNFTPDELRQLVSRARSFFPDIATRIAHRLDAIEEIDIDEDGILPSLGAVDAARRVAGYLPRDTVMPRIEIDDSVGSISFVWKDSESRNSFSLEFPNADVVLGIGAGPTGRKVEPWQCVVADERRMLSNLESSTFVKALLSGA
jgi:hypothetical protein